MNDAALLRALRGHDPSSMAITDGAQCRLTYRDLPLAIELVAAQLARHARPGDVVALHADNGPAWAITALAAAGSGRVLLPLPLFFSTGQLRHALRVAGATLIVTDAPAALKDLAVDATPCGLVAGLSLVRTSQPPVSLPDRTATITFTSGTTGEPKGVCLGAVQLGAACAALQQATQITAEDRHLAVLPLPVLLEEIGGLRRALLAGATTVLPPLEAVGLCGSVGLRPGRLAAALAQQQATSAILTPQMLAGLVQAIEHGAARPTALRFLGVGGAAVPVPLLRRGRALGLPAHEGYGLTEMASVVSLNTPGADRPGSVGRPLAHVQVRVAPDGELLVRGPHHLGTLGGDGLTLRDGWLATGDLGRVDEDGFVHVAGRLKNMFITSFGRNVSPEWIERELLADDAVAAAAVFGEGWPAPRAVLVAAAGHEAELPRAVAATNERLPDYARLDAFVVADEPFAPRNGLATANGRPRRDAIAAAYAPRLAPRAPIPLPTETAS